MKILQRAFGWCEESRIMRTANSS